MIQRTHFYIAKYTMHGAFDQWHGEFLCDLLVLITEILNNNQFHGGPCFVGLFLRSLKPWWQVAKEITVPKHWGNSEEVNPCQHYQAPPCLMIVASSWCREVLKSLPFIAVICCLDCVSSCLFFGVPGLCSWLYLVSAKSFIIRWKLRHQCFVLNSLFHTLEDPQVAHVTCLLCRCFSHTVVEQDVLQESLHQYAAWKASCGYLYRPIGWLDHFLILADASRWIVLAPPNGILYSTLYSMLYICFHPIYSVLLFCCLLF